MAKTIFASIAIAVACGISPALASGQQELASAVAAANDDHHSGWIVERLMSFEVGDKCFAKIVDKKNRALGLIAAHTRYIARYAKTVTGDDWTRMEADKKSDAVDTLVNDFKSNVHITISVEGDDCEASGNALWLKYLGEVTGALAKYAPKKLMIVIKVSAKAKGVKADVKNGTLTIIGARDVEASGWPNEIDKAMRPSDIDKALSRRR